MKKQLLVGIEEMETNILDDLGLNVNDAYVSKMICSACVCNGCTSYLWCDRLDETGEAPDENKFTSKEIKEASHCNGYSCIKYRKNSFRGYDWECNE